MATFPAETGGARAPTLDPLMSGPHKPAHPHSTRKGFTEPAKKSLGQHFLVDRTVIEKIVQAVNPKDDDRLVEIGPGQGGMDQPLLRVHQKLTGLEFERDVFAPRSAAGVS